MLRLLGPFERRTTRAVIRCILSLFGRRLLGWVRADAAEIALAEIFNLNDWERGLLLRKRASARALLRDLRPASLRGPYSARFPAKWPPSVLPHARSRIS
jgi:hypothetical protein